MQSWDRWLPLGVVALFVAIGALAYSTNITLGIPEGDVERATVLYTDIGIQMTAGIFAIIISLSLVAIQFAAQEYSHRIIEYYLRSVIFWTTLLVYLAVIGAGIVFQANAEASDDVRFAMLIVVGSFLALTLLIPHFLITAAYLKPEFIVAKLIRRVDQHYLRSTIDARPLPAPSGDRLLPVVEIVERSIDRGDLTTTRGALEQVRDSYTEYGLPCASDDVDNYYIAALSRLARKAIANQDEEQAAVLAIQDLSAIGVSRSPGTVIDVLDELGVRALRRDVEAAVAATMLAVKNVAVAHNDQEWARALEAFSELARRMAPDDQQRLLRDLIAHLAEAAPEWARTRNVALASEAVGLFEDIGHGAAVKQTRGIIRQALQALSAVGIAGAGPEPRIAEACRDAILRVEQAINRGDRDSVSVAGFARGEVESALSEHSTVPREEAVVEESAASPELSDPLGLWGKTED